MFSENQELSLHYPHLHPVILPIPPTLDRELMLFPDCLLLLVLVPEVITITINQHESTKVCESRINKNIHIDPS